MVRARSGRYRSTTSGRPAPPTIVSALHEVPIGQAWTEAAVAERKALIETTPAGRTPLVWSVVESIPIPDAVKRRGGAARAEIEAWIASLEARRRQRHHASSATISCRWSTGRRTDLDCADADRRDRDALRPGPIRRLRPPHPGAAPAPERDYSRGRPAAAPGAVYDAMSEAEVATLVTQSSQRPARLDHRAPDACRRSASALANYRGIDAARLRAPSRRIPGGGDAGRRGARHHADAASRRSAAPALRPAAHRLDGGRFRGALRGRAVAGQRHVLLHRQPRRARRQRPAGDGGALRRVASTSPICARPSGRATARASTKAAHLDGDVDMVAVLKALVAEDRRRDESATIVFRPDHGHRMLDDLDKAGHAGLPGDRPHARARRASRHPARTGSAAGLIARPIAKRRCAPAPARRDVRGRAPAPAPASRLLRSRTCRYCPS